MRNTMIYSLVIVWLSLVVSNSYAQSTQPLKFTESTVIAKQLSVFEGTPWGMSFVDNESLLITIKQGDVWLLNSITAEKKQVIGLPEIPVFGQGGLLDVAVHPAVYKNRDGDPYKWVYFTYIVALEGRATTALGRAQLSLNTNNSSVIRLVQWRTLLITKAFSNKGQHFGSRIAFDDAGHVFFGVGDRGTRETSQDLSNHAGTIIRLNLDGSVPADNPFVGTAQSLPHIWSYGHRNPQGLAFDSSTQSLFSSEHGPRGGDEINLIKKGENYGWPIVSFGKEYWGPFAVGEGTEKAGMQAPLHVYIPSIAPSFLVQYQSDHFFLGALAKTHLNSVRLKKQAGQFVISESRMLKSLAERVRSMAIRADGRAYIGADSGKIYTIEFDK